MSLLKTMESEHHTDEQSQDRLDHEMPKRSSIDDEQKPKPLPSLLDSLSDPEKRHKGKKLRILKDKE
tara:strand:+ start:1251 stop:1451 length:201 start_codon:yes stop_codon:yes gene_type:complete